MSFLKKKQPTIAAVEPSGEEPNRWATSLSDWAYLLVVLVMTIGMLIINAIVCLSLHSFFTAFGPAWLVDYSTILPYLGQLFFFLVPVLLTVVQWNLLDRLDKLFRRP